MADFVFRPHRALYSDSMALAQSFASWDALEAHLGEPITKIERYAADDRNGWDTHIVMTVSGVAGFTNGPVARATFHRNLTVLSWEGDGEQRRFAIDGDAPESIGSVLESAELWPVGRFGVDTGFRWSYDGSALIVSEDQDPPAEGVIISCSYEPAPYEGDGEWTHFTLSDTGDPEQRRLAERVDAAFGLGKPKP